MPYRGLDGYRKIFGYGKCTDVEIGGKMIKVLPLAHPRQIARLGSSKKWYVIHQKWLAEQNNKKNNCIKIPELPDDRKFILELLWCAQHGRTLMGESP